MNIREILSQMPIGRWSEINTTEGRMDIYRCDTTAAAEDWFIVERPAGRKHRFTLGQAIGFFQSRMLDE